MTSLDAATLAYVRGGAGFLDSVKTGASNAWNGVVDFSGGFASGFLGYRRDEQLWGNSGSRASKGGGELGELASTGFGPGRMRLPRR
jgi:hypothetical protein